MTKETATADTPVPTDIIDPDALPAEQPDAALSADEQAAQAEFAKGYSEFSDVPAVNTPDGGSGESVTPATDEPAKPVAEMPVEPVKPKVVEITEDKLAAIEKLAAEVADVRTKVDTAFGKFGTVERTLKQMQERAPRGEAVRATLEDLSEMTQEYPELADLTVKGFNRILERVQVTGGSSPADMAKLMESISVGVKEEVSREREALLLDVLNGTREDWFEVVGTDEENWSKLNPGKPYEPTPYRQWLATQPQDYQEAMNSSMSPSQIVKSINKFEKFQDDQKKALEAARKPAPKPSDSRRNRLAAAVVPDSTGRAGVTTEPTEAEEFANGYKEMANA